MEGVIEESVEERLIVRPRTDHTGVGIIDLTKLMLEALEDIREELKEQRGIQSEQMALLAALVEAGERDE